MICEFLASFSRREQKRPSPVRNPAPDARTNRDSAPANVSADVSRKAQTGASK